jgi:G protein-coupled receptor 157
MATSTGLTNVLHKETGERVAVGITCGLSILGSILIIVSYILFKNVRTRARLILLHLSLMDLGVGLANLAGDIARFERFYVQNGTITDHPGRAPRFFCEAQAFLAMLFTISSILWTCAIAVYMYFLAIEKSSLFMRRLIWVFYTLCYGMSLVIAIWTLCTGRLGYTPYNSGWCSLIVKRVPTVWMTSSGRRWAGTDIYGVVFSYDLWIITSIILIIVVYLSTHFLIKREVSLVAKFVH